MKALILAGGRGTRLRPLTYACPKGLVPVANRPFIEYQLDLMRRHGIQHVILSLNYMAEMFKEALSKGKEWGISFQYSIEERLLGTGGAIARCRKMIGDERALVINGDVLTDIDIGKLLEFHIQKAGEITIALAEVADPTAYGLVLLDGTAKVARFIEKPSWDEVSCNIINAGIYVIEPQGLDRIVSEIDRAAAGDRGRAENGEVSLERDIFPKLIAQGCSIYGYPLCNYWLDIGTLSKYMEAHRDILGLKLDTMLPGRRFGRGVRVGKEVKIHKSAQIEGPVLIGDRAVIHAGARIGPWAVLGESVEVGEKTDISESILHPKVSVGKGAKLRWAIAADSVKVEDGCYLEYVVLGPGTRLTRECVVGEWVMGR